jgi:hypothetical protein
MKLLISCCGSELRVPYFFPLFNNTYRIYLLGLMYFFIPLPPLRGQATQSLVATHLGIDRVCRGLRRSRIRTRDC